MGSNPATPTTVPAGAPATGKITFWGVYRLRLLCKLRARVSALSRLSRAAKSAEAPPTGGEGQQNPKKSAPKETEP